MRVGGRAECPLLAIPRPSGHVRGRSALPPTADVTGGVAEGPLLTQSGHSGSYQGPIYRCRCSGSQKESDRPHYFTDTVSCIVPGRIEKSFYLP